MDFVHQLLTFLHLIGFASLFGGFFTQLKAKAPVVNAAMLHGALTQLVTGVLLVGLASGIKDDDFTVNNAKIGVKLLVVLVITGVVFAYRKKPALTRGMFFAIGGLTAANAAIAVFW
ncbi:hypothetical protein HPO96_30180 [Kribbella sandramycini]|uniref:Integral membrane protein n=1 Tax=Kribbella sandramycini TaxID=60450 RepID=A0A7Y4P1Q7_9ACTN|nr:hypothetical protein [Kribbella sandramycini]MBB6566799.1 hypothetical protein [Kribbella sandramycini]NOL44522.1 hypothetical protein [Kribbella sandramycini]